MLNYVELNAAVCSLTEEQLIDLIEQELSGPKRTSILVRLHQRYTRVRAARERKEMLEGLTRTTLPDEHCSA